MYRKTKVWVMASLLAAFVAGCGGGGGSSESTAPATQTGVFIDSAVEGIKYQTATQSGLTNSAGEFKYVEGETVTFSIGGINLPAATASSVMTPLTLVGTSSSTDTTVVNIARLLQTLDADGDPSNGISISSTAHTAASGLTVSFDSATFDNDVNALVVNSGSVNTTLVSTVNAVDHLNSSIETMNNPLIGSWYFQTGEFNADEPGNITFRENGYYTVYADCSKQVEPVPNVDLEIGTYTYADGLLTITSHIQNGCGGFDHEEDATIPPDSPLNVTFNSDGSSMTLTLYGVTLAKVQDTASPIVGGWEIGTFDASDAHTVTFYKNGYYTVYSDCSNQVEPSPNVNLEIGTYTYADGLLTITSHIQNGCGGFDDESGTGIPPVDPINISFSADKSAMTIVNYNLTFTRIE